MRGFTSISNDLCRNYRHFYKLFAHICSLTLIQYTNYDL
uniref:Uncharacterized protein n=1 Tax=Anguilla anguilla TaxID=7936 RepID=A0A0E9WDP7_ANGAN